MATASSYPWQQTLGAAPRDDGSTEFRVWAPRAKRVAVRIGRREEQLREAGHGIHEAVVAAIPGDDYLYVVDGERLPDPCSRFQPHGLRGPSRVTDTAAFEWTDSGWTTVPLAELVLYELHVGTFTEAGTFEAVIPHLERLRELGITAIELMPVIDGPGVRGWGYDGVHAYAPHAAYGGPDGLHRLVDAAHAAGMAVILDVVYNHVGASGVAAIESFGAYFTERYDTDWGKAINYDDELCDPVREWAIQSACMWVGDYHVDGLRLDAVHAIFDFSARHVLEEMAERVHEISPGALVIAESSLNDARLIRARERGGYGLDAQWADDFHHALRVLLTGENEGYYRDFGRVADLAKAYHRPFVYDGRYSEVRRRVFGAPANDRPVEQFVVFNQNHDQVGNRALGDRMPEHARPLAAFCTLLSPFTPMLFMGEEYGEPSPFQFFTDHIDRKIARATRAGRRREFAEFAEFSGSSVPDPQSAKTFLRSKLSRQEDPRIADLYRRLLDVRRQLPPGEAASEFDESARWLRVTRGDWELVCNFNADPAAVSTGKREVVLATHDATLDGGNVDLPGWAGALLR